METRITIYRDPLNEQKWIVAIDQGDPSEETVLTERSDYDDAKAFAEKRAAAIGVDVIEDVCDLR